MAKKNQKYYVVWKGRETGVFTSWTECEKQIKAYTGAVYKSFKSKELAEKAFKSESGQFIGNNIFISELTEEQKLLIGKPIPDSLSVDAACSGNPGILEYRGVDTKTGIELFRQGPFPEGTVNIGEFLALVHGLAYLKKIKSNIPIYSDSRTAIKWVKTKVVKTKLERTSKNEELFKLVDRAVNWLHNNTFPNKILKWETAAWGEIPADFGRK